MLYSVGNHCLAALLFRHTSRRSDGEPGTLSFAMPVLIAAGCFAWYVDSECFVYYTMFKSYSFGRQNEALNARENKMKEPRIEQNTHWQCAAELQIVAAL